MNPTAPHLEPEVRACLTAARNVVASFTSAITAAAIAIQPVAQALDSYWRSLSKAERAKIMRGGEG